MSKQKFSKERLREVCSKFRIYGDFADAVPYGSGHINDTFAATYSQGGTEIRYILQRINHNIFKNPPALMDNIRRVTEHIGKKTAGDQMSSRRNLTLIPTSDGMSYHKDADGNHWRVYIFVEKADTFNIIENAGQAFEAAKAFGKFQKNLVDLGGPRLYETIPDFHNTVQRFRNLEKAVAEDKVNRVKSVAKEIEFAFGRKEMAEKLLKLNAQGLIPERITHNDTKLNNVLIDQKTGEGVCVIDLDTVMPGLALYDFGDLVRTSTSPAAEDEKDLSKVKMQMHMFEALVKGYLSDPEPFLVKEETANLAFCGKLITFEIGLRFLTDFLDGDVYFKIHREGHNLDRCRTQFKLVESIEEQEDAMNKLVEKIAGRQ